MFNKILSILGAKKFLSEDVLKKGLQKVDPRLKKFFSESERYGYPIGAALGFLKNEFTGEKEQPVDRQLRPDESANIEIRRQQEAPQKLLGKAANIASGAALGGLGGTALSGISQLIGSGGQQESQTQPQAQQPSQPGTREEALKRYNEMNKKRKLLEQAQQEFENEYGQGNVPPDRFSAQSTQGSNAAQGSTRKTALLEALREVKQILGG